MTSDTTVVVEEVEALDSAYDAGYSEFDEVPAAESDEPADLSFFTGSARYANIVAPRLRATAGLADRGHGTYQEDREIALVPVGNEDDKPAECRLMSARDFFQHAVHPEWRRGAYDALEGHPRGHSVDRESEIAPHE